MPRPSDPHRAERGRAAERHARRFLEARGCRTLAENFRTRWGEIDLVMEQGEQLIFVEVRARMNNNFGGAVASVSAAKQIRIIRAASRFLEQHRLAHRPVRFDIVALSGSDCSDERTEWLVDAFRPDE